MPFIGELVTKPLPLRFEQRKLFNIVPYKKTIIEWEIYEDFGYKDNELNITVIVVKGSRTDFASIPRIFWSILPPWYPTYGQPAVIHDYLYRHGLYTRKISDLIFLHAMQESNVVLWKQIIMFNAVRIFGRSSYQKSHTSSLRIL